MNNRQRNAVSIVELLVAFALLAVLLSAIGKFAAHVNRASQDLELSMLIQIELQNVREQVGAWETSLVTKERIEALPIPQSLCDRFEKAWWDVEIKPGTISNWQVSPMPVQIRLALNAMSGEQHQIPAELYFWIPGDTDSVQNISSKEETGSP